MIAIDRMTDAEFDSVAFDLLARELGADGLAAFSDCTVPTKETTRRSAKSGSRVSRSTTLGNLFDASAIKLVDLRRHRFKTRYNPFVIDISWRK